MIVGTGAASSLLCHIVGVFKFLAIADRLWVTHSVDNEHVSRASQTLVLRGMVVVAERRSLLHTRLILIFKYVIFRTRRAVTDRGRVRAVRERQTVHTISQLALSRNQEVSSLASLAQILQ